MRRFLASCAPVLLAAAVGACGNSRGHAADVLHPQPPAGLRRASYPAQGVSFRAPSNWRLTGGGAPQVAVLQSGRAVLAIWRYPRFEPLPAGRTALRAARRALVGEVRHRDRTARVVRSRVLRAARAPAIQLLADETIAGQRRRVRSTHVFAFGAEVVVDAYADRADFRSADRGVFAPLLRSLRLRVPRG